MKNQVHILIYEPAFQTGLIIEEALKEEGFSTVCFSNEEKAFEEFCSTSPHLCILNLAGNSTISFALANKIKAHDKSAAIIFFANIPTREEIKEAYQAGADDYIRKPLDIKEMIARVKAVLKRTNCLQNTKPEIPIYKFGNFTFDTHKQILSIENSEHKLTTKEYELLLLFCQHANSLVDRNHTLQAIWRDDSHFSARSMDVYITKLRHILKKDPSIKILNIHGKGYKLVTR